jgi:hypothetical protein
MNRHDTVLIALLTSQEYILIPRCREQPRSMDVHSTPNATNVRFLSAVVSLVATGAADATIGHSENINKKKSTKTEGMQTERE